MEPPSESERPRKPTDPVLERFGANLRKLRDDAGMSRDELAKQLGGKATGKMVENWESGMTNPDVRYIYRAARLFSVSLNELFGHDPEDPWDAAVGKTAAYIREMLRTVDGRVGFTINVQPHQDIGQQINFPTPKRDFGGEDSGDSSGNSFQDRKAM